MGANLNSDEVEQKYIDSMGLELGPVYNRLQAECTFLNATWRQFVELFATSELRAKVLVWSAEYFFEVVRDTFLEATLLKLSRITDPVIIGKKKNVTLALLPPLVDSALRPQIDVAFQAVVAATAFARDWRNRHIAHQDFGLVFDGGVTPLAVVTRKKIDDAIAAINMLLNLIENYYGDATMAFDRLIARGQADDLLQVLNEEYQKDKEFQTKLESRTLTAADFHRRFRERI